MINHDKILCHKKSVEILNGFIIMFRNAEGVHGLRKVGNPWSSGLGSEPDEVG